MLKLDLLCGCLVLGLTACNNTEPSSFSGGSDQAGLDVILHETIDFRAATDEECPAGGGVYSLYSDQNSNGLLDPDETVIHAQKLCNGMSGANGADGNNGMNAVFASVPAPLQVCPGGGVTFLMALDAFGTGVYTALDPNQQSATVCNGTNGTDGHDAPVSEFTIVETLMPCGKTVNYKEVLLRFANGEVLASFSDNASGKNTRFAFLSDGTYVDTDDSSCRFSLSTSVDGKMRSISWNGHEQASWPMHN